MSHLFSTVQTSMFGVQEDVESVETFREPSVLISLSSIERIRNLDNGIESLLLTEESVEKLYGSFRGIQGHMLLYLYKIMYLIKLNGNSEYPLSGIPIYDSNLKIFLDEFVRVYVSLIYHPNTRISDLVIIAFQEWFRLNSFKNHLNANGQSSFVTNEISLEKLKEMWAIARKSLREKVLLRRLEDNNANLRELGGCELHLEIPVILHLCIGDEELRIYIRLDTFIHSHSLDRDKTSLCIDDKFGTIKEFDKYEKLQIILLNIVTRLLSLKKNIKAGETQYFKVEISDVLDLLDYLPSRVEDSNVMYRYFVENQQIERVVFVDTFEVCECLGILTGIIAGCIRYKRQLAKSHDVSAVYSPTLDLETLSFSYQRRLFIEQ